MTGNRKSELTSPSAPHITASISPSSTSSTSTSTMIALFVGHGATWTLLVVEDGQYGTVSHGCIIQPRSIEWRPEEQGPKTYLPYVISRDYKYWIIVHPSRYSHPITVFPAVAAIRARENNPKIIRKYYVPSGFKVVDLNLFLPSLWNSPNGCASELSPPLQALAIPGARNLDL